MKITRRRFLAALGTGAAVSVGTGAYAVWVEPTWLRTVEVDVPMPGLGAALDGYTIAQLSDLHVGGGAPADLIREAVEAAGAAKPDLVALTGDFVQGHRDVESCAREVGDLLSGLSARDGVLAVLGNHDAGVFSARRDRPDAGRIELVGRELARAGARLIENEALVVTRGEDRLRVVGLGDLWCRRFEPGRILPAEPRLPTVALSHNPDTAPRLSCLGCDLILSGHTHGGQVSIPLIGPPMLPVRRKDLAAGLCRLGEDPDAPDPEEPAYVYVNRGVGWLRRIRFRVRPEVTVLRLRRA